MSTETTSMAIAVVNTGASIVRVECDEYRVIDSVLYLLVCNRTVAIFAAGCWVHVKFEDLDETDEPHD